MALTLGNQRDLTNDMLVKGIIDSIVTVNQFYQHLPFKGIQGNALAYNREDSTVDTKNLVGTMDTRANPDNVINKQQMQFTRHSTELTTIIGDAQVNGLIQAVGSDYNNATAVQVAAKAKGVGRKFMDLMITGNMAPASATPPVLLTAAVPALSATSAVKPAEFLAKITAAMALFGNAATMELDSGLVAYAQGAFVTAMVIADGSSGEIDKIYIQGVAEPFVGPFTGTVDGTTGAFTATQAGIDLYNAAAMAVYNNELTLSVNTEHGLNGFDGLARFVQLSGKISTDAGDDVDDAATAEDLLTNLDKYIDEVKDKDGMVDYIMTNSAGVRKYTKALRLSNAAGFDDVMEVKNSSGGIMKVQSYRGVPIYRNDFIVTPTGSTYSDVYVGTIDDGSLSHGISGLTALNSSGIQVSKLGAMEMSDSEITRVKWYAGLANFSELGLYRGRI